MRSAAMEITADCWVKAYRRVIPELSGEDMDKEKPQKNTN